MIADEYLHTLWCELRNDARPIAIAHIRGAIDMAKQSGLITTEQAELWERLIDTCPGHDDEGSRAWCAYCGDMPAGGEEK